MMATTEEPTNDTRDERLIALAIPQRRAGGDKTSEPGIAPHWQNRTICCALECEIRGNSEPGLVMASIAGPLYANQGASEHRQGRADHSKGPTMYQINFETCTADDVITRS